MNSIRKLLACAFVSVSAFVAGAIGVGPLNYSLSGQQATVTGLNSDYSEELSELVIPAQIDVDGTTYTVSDVAATAFCKKALPERVVFAGKVTLNPSRSVSFEWGVFNQATGVREIVFLDAAAGSVIAPYFITNSSVERLVLAPESEVARYACNQARNLKEVTVGYGSTLSSGCFSVCPALESVTLGRDVTVGSEAFKSCTAISSFTLGKGCSIGQNAFDKCEIVSVDVPDGCTFDSDAMSACKTIKLIRFLGFASIAPNSFPLATVDDVYCTEILPVANTLAELGSSESADEWSKFAPKPYAGRLHVPAGSEVNYANQGFDYKKRWSVNSKLYYYYTTKMWSLFENTLGDGELSESGNGGGRAEASVRVRGTESHTVMHYYTEGQKARIDVTPDEGWTIHSVKFNSEDVTDRLDNNTYTTDPLHGENLLEVIMLKDATQGVGQVGAESGVTIAVADGSVVVSGCAAGTEISVYTAGGVLVHRGVEPVIALGRGVYVLEVAGQAFKFTV